MTMIMSNRSVLDPFHEERQRRLRPRPRQGGSLRPARARWRVWIGHALIGAGSALSGERVEPALPAPKAHPRAA